MPDVDFSQVEDAEDYSPLPAGKYLCKVTEIEQKRTLADDEMWRLRLTVVEGEHQGRSVFDNMVFSERAMKRVKLMCSRMGLDVSGFVALTPKTLQGRKVVVTVEVGTYQDNEGNEKLSNSVPFAGYERVPVGVSAQPGQAVSGGDPSVGVVTDDDIPF